MPLGSFSRRSNILLSRYSSSVKNRLRIDAIAAFNKAVAIKQNYYPPYYRLAALYNKLGKHQQALDAALGCLKYKKNYAPAAFETGMAYKKLGQFNNAVKYYQIAAKSRNWRKSANYQIDMMKRKMKAKGVASIEDLRELCLEAEVKMIACQMTVDLFDMPTSEFIEDIEYGGAATFFEFAGESDICLYI